MHDSLDNYKFGNTYYGEIPAEQIQKYVELFGEGSPQLSELLSFCFKNGIRTFASCKGHKDKGSGRGYIGFLPDLDLASYLCEMADQTPIYRIIVDKRRGDLRTIIYVKNENYFPPILSLLKKYVNQKNNGNYYSPRFEKTMNLIKQIEYDDNPAQKLIIMDGQYELIDEKYNIIEQEIYCPNATITHMLHSRLINIIRNPFVAKSDETGFKSGK